ncbi:MAG: SDR family NAD(P)-dependent oxidoreductase [Desulfomonilia bacterium]
MKNLKDNVVVVTGASGGIGKALALAFAEEGCNVVICARRKDELEKVAYEIRAKGREALAIPTDVSDESQVKAMAAEAFKRFGEVDILVCNAGFGWTGPTHLMERSDWDTVFNTNFFGVVHFIRHFVPAMTKQRHGHVVIISSIFGITCIPYGTLYASSKAALIALGECLRSELQRYRVGVTTVCPGYIESDLIANTRFKMVEKEARKLASLVKPMPVEKCARIIIRAVKRNKGVIVITGLAKFFWYCKRISQRLYEIISLVITFSTRRYVEE